MSKTSKIILIVAISLVCIPIIVVGIIALVLFVVPSSNKKIKNTKSSAYVEEVKKLANDGEALFYQLGNYEASTTYYLPIKCVNSLSESPYGEFDEAYVVVGVTDNYKTEIYWIGKDKTNTGIEKLTGIKELNTKSIAKNIKRLDTNQLVDGTNKKRTLNYNNCTTYE